MEGQLLHGEVVEGGICPGRLARALPLVRQVAAPWRRVRGHVRHVAVTPRRRAARHQHQIIEPAVRSV